MELALLGATVPDCPRWGLVSLALCGRAWGRQDKSRGRMGQG